MNLTGKHFFVKLHIEDTQMLLIDLPLCTFDNKYIFVLYFCASTGI